MPIYDYECPDCGVFERIAPVSEELLLCDCGRLSKRIISASGAYCSNEDAAWIRTVREVVDKDGGVHCKRFLKEPTRENYRKWMAGEGIRPMEPGEKPKRAPGLDMARHTDKLVKAYKRRHAVEIR